MKNVLIISSSPRINGNSDTLCREFERGAKEAGHNVKYINLVEKKINYCLACYACTNTGKCFQKDDFNEILDLALKADVILFATPVYFYSMSGQLKVFIDRLVANYTAIRSDIYIFVSAWDSNKNNLESTLEAIRGCTRDCLESCPEKGFILAGGVTNKGEVNSHKDYLEKAYNFGLHC